MRRVTATRDSRPILHLHSGKKSFYGVTFISLWRASKQTLRSIGRR